jgi:hypothetical protein
MDFKKTVKEGYNAIADRYLAERRRDSEDVHLLDELIEKLRVGARNGEFCMPLLFQPA